MQRARNPIHIGLLFWTTLSLWKAPVGAQTTGLSQPELITDRQGLPQGFVPDIVQDRQGFIWMATHDGLCRYDGNRFKVFREQTTGKSPMPFSSISALCLDHLGRIWATSEQGEVVVVDPRTEKFTNISKQLARLPYPHISPRQYYPDRQNRLWLAFDGQGLVCYDLTSRRVRWFRHRANDPHSIGTDQIRSVLQDQQGAIWIGTADAGLERFEEKTGHFLHYRPDSPMPLALPELSIFGLYQRPSGELLLGTHHYICQFNPKTGQFRSYRLPDEDASVLGEHHMWGTRFVTDSRGSVYLDRRNRLFRFSDQQGLQLLARFTPQTGYCSSLLIDRSDVLWIGTDGSGVRKYDLRADGFQTARYQAGFQVDVFTQWLHLPAAQVSPIRNTDPYMFRYTLDRQGGLWANVGKSTFYHINPATHLGEQVEFPVPYYATVSPMAADEQGHIWTLNWYNNRHYLWYYDPARRQWIRSAYTFEREYDTHFIQMVADQDAFWFATDDQGLFRFDRRTGNMRQYVHQPNQPTSISSNTLYCLSADPTDPNRLWVGTFGKGLCAFDKQSGQSRRITEQDGLPNNVIYSALPDGRGYLWIGTNKGLCRMHRRTFQMRTYTIDDGLLANEFNRFHYVHLPGPAFRSDGTAHDDQIIMGGVEGITSFQPAQLQDDSFQPHVELTELYVNNRLALPDSSSFLRAPIQAVKQLSLPYNQNFLTVHFAALQFNRPGKNRYRYRLEGVDKNWVETSQPQAIYTTLAPNRYTLLVNASNTSGVWSPQVRRLGILISPPFWATWWAYVLYVLAVAGSIWYGIRLYLSRLQLQQAIELQQQQVEIKQREVELQQQEAQQLRTLDEMKSRFFTNVTHDFRTPLTLILSPLDRLLALSPLPPVDKLRQQFGLMRRNAQQLLGLINQLLDFSKLDANLLTVQEARGNVGQFVDQTLHLFQDEADRKMITVSYQSDLSGDYWFDADKLERVLANLLGNALKFTPAGGQINVSLKEAGGILLIISDTGVGIAEDKLPYIFDRFYQGYAHAVDVAETSLPATETPQQAGTGIGLSVVKELIELQHGQISVESQPGQGTTFRISLPYRKADDANQPVDALAQPPATSQVDVSIAVATERTDEHPLGEYPLGEPPHLLLVEDNPELADFIADSLPDHYRVSRATNGVEGLQLALAELPDLVISDVMMPLMDGYTLCQKLKDDERTNHIPVILLTAKVTLDNRLEGLTRGADDYLNKPFHMQELNLRIHNLLERQQRLRERMRQELSRPGLEGPGRADGPLDGPREGSELEEALQPEPANPTPPNPFLEKLYSAIDARLDDTSFSVEELAEVANMSRAHLHRKLKVLTGLPAGDLIRNYRLKRATQLLRQGFNSSETAYQVGFDSPQYFAKCFRDVYQMTPKEFAKNGQTTA